MHLLTTPFEYRSWMMTHYFMIDSVEGASLLSEEELDEYLFDLRPLDYPCLAMIGTSINQPLLNEVTFIYREQIALWAEKMGVN